MKIINWLPYVTECSMVYKLFLQIRPTARTAYIEQPIMCELNVESYNSECGLLCSCFIYSPTYNENLLGFPSLKKKKIKLMLYLKVVQFVVFLFCCLFVAALGVVFLFVCLPVCLFRDVVVFNSFKAEKKSS